ncbi:MAG: rhodanese-like domain-containing protein [Deltaproteobacteria bacterium]|nr:rhodanese-like domain-containing protein [Deltaproteobacteria bacterium]
MYLIRSIRLLAVISFSLMMTMSLQAAEQKGKIQSISNKAKTIQFMDLKSKEVNTVKFGKATKFINAKSSKEFIVNDVILIDFDPGKEAKSIKRVLVELPKNKVISTKKLASLLDNKTSVFSLYDARPLGSYQQGHLLGAVSFPPEKLEANLSLLPKDKDRLLVFYCGGPT